MREAQGGGAEGNRGNGGGFNMLQGTKIIVNHHLILGYQDFLFTTHLVHSLVNSDGLFPNFVGQKQVIEINILPFRVSHSIFPGIHAEL